MKVGPIYPLVFLIVAAILAGLDVITGGEFLAAVSGGAIALPASLRQGDE